jgi:uncharacterized protein YcfJ
MVNKNAVIIGLSAVLMVISTAAATLYISGRNAEQPPPPQPQPQVVIHNSTIGPKQTVSATPHCNDQNIAGKVIGGIGGGVLGSTIGRGSGKTAATIGGALGGAYLGGEALPLQNTTCPH